MKGTAIKKHIPEDPKLPYQLRVDVSQFNRRFLVISCASIVILSFFFGLVRGLSEKLPPAYAALAPNFLSGNYSSSLRHLSLPHGVIPLPVGNDLSVNGMSAEVIQFVTNRDVVGVLKELTAEWESKGLVAIGATNSQRGMVIGVDPKTRNRYSAIASTVPPKLRGLSSHGYSVQGTASFIEASSAGDSTPNSVLEVDGVPLIPGGRSGGVFKSRDYGGENSTAFYTNPGSVGQNIGFYREQLSASGWIEGGGGYEDELASGPFAHLRFVKGSREVVLMLSKVQNSERSDRGEQSLVFVVTRPAGREAAA